MAPRAPERLAALSAARAHCLRSVRRLCARARRERWTLRRLRQELRRARIHALARRASSKQWYAAVRKVFGSSVREIALVDRRQLTLPFEVAS